MLGPDEYLFGEEKALLEVIEGHDPLPRLLPPYEHGLFATDVQTGWQSVDAPTVGPKGQPNPTLVNNVETLAHVPRIIRDGADWFRSMGTAESPGTTVATVVGDVVGPFVGEIELGIPLWDLIAEAGGLRDGRQVQAVFSGVANAAITADQLDTPVSYEGAGGRRQRARVGRLHRLRRLRLHGRGRTRALPLPLRRELRPVPQLQVRQRRDHPHPRHHRRRRAAPTATSR